MYEPSSKSEYDSVRQDAETYGNVPQSTASYGKLPHAAAAFRNMPHSAEITERHTLTVKEVARMFEQAGVPRIERSIINWCQPNRQGIARLDAFFDTNERKYFITLQSVTAAIGEEQAKQRASEKVTPPESTDELRHDAETAAPHRTRRESDREQAREFDLKLRDLEITNRVKDKHIEMLEKERERFNEERQQYVTQLIGMSRLAGDMERRLLQLGERKPEPERPTEVESELAHSLEGGNR
jgi:hypothetical protein